LVALVFSERAQKVGGERVRVLVLGEVASFRHIVVSALRSQGVEASEADLGREGETALQGQTPDIIVLHLHSNVMANAYFERVSVLAGTGRIVVVEESGPLPLRSRAPAGVTFLARPAVQELIASIRAMAMG
jgi:CheY-like chemotaxis protein